MRYLLLPLILLLQFVTASAQDDYQNWGQAYGFSPKDIRYVYADTANIRTAPQQDAQVQDKLNQGDLVTIIATGKVFVLHGKSAPWCEVSYKNSGIDKRGFLWSGLLSPRTLKKDHILFLYGMNFPSADTLPSVVDAKAIRNDSLISHISFTISSRETAGGAHKASILPSKGLGGLTCLLYFYYSGEACAIPTIEQYIGWDGKQFITLPQIYSESDAGAFAMEQKYIFPADKSGKPNELRMRERIEQYNENGDKVTGKKTSTTRYHWDAATKKLRKL